MPILSLSQNAQAHAEISALFRKAPVPVEVRFPQMATSPDWYLCEDEADLTPILDRLSRGAELHLSSVWDLKNPAGELTLRK